MSDRERQSPSEERNSLPPVGSFEKPYDHELAAIHRAAARDSAVSHDTAVTHVDVGQRLKFYGRCSCGWRSRIYPKFVTARFEADLHERVEAVKQDGRP